jgi:hypothetical protein
MPTERLAMRHMRDVIRLKSAGMSTREIARRMGTAPSTVRLTIRRFEAAGPHPDLWKFNSDREDCGQRPISPPKDFRRAPRVRGIQAYRDRAWGGWNLPHDRKRKRKASV